ncbi:MULTISPECIES: FHA domain-containing protein [Nocardiopsis]|uniref:FHA domain-containing protein n=1 Tax=Nocardiopsis TaxID=2013 RepID=UPI001478EF0E|nr:MULTISPECIES: FHA domain-containing protein [Nocardiopsis]
MSFFIVGCEGPFSQQRFPVGDVPVTFGRHAGNSVVVVSKVASRFHAEIVREGDEHVLYDRESSNGTTVNGEETTSHVLRPGDLVTIGDETFRWEFSETPAEADGPPVTQMFVRSAVVSGPVLHVAVSGGGPVGLALALLLEHLIGPQVVVTVYDGRWTRDGSRVVWKDERQGNVRRQQVVTVQSRQYLNLSEEMRDRLFDAGSYTEMWPAGPDSIRGYGPRNIRISRVEDVLLEMANERPRRIRLVPEEFDAAGHHQVVADSHVLAVCEGAGSRTRAYFTDKFGQADRTIYSLGGEHVQDVVLGLRVRSDLTDPTTVLLTVAQNRFLLNSLRGEGFLNMRLTDAEAGEVVGIDPVRQVFQECVASRPCVMGRDGHGDFACPTHSTLFLPAMVGGSALWKRVRQGLALFGVAEDNLSAVTAFRLNMVQRPRFTAQLRSTTPTSPGTYGFLLGDAANAIHFWPGRGLNSGLASAISLARSLSSAWSGRPFRDADFIRHEAAMSMLQYRHKSRAWKAMVTTDEDGAVCTFKDRIARSMDEEGPGREADLETMMERLGAIRERLSPRVPGMPDDVSLRNHLCLLDDETLRSLVAGGPWDTLAVGGEEVDIDIFYRDEAQAVPAAEA